MEPSSSSITSWNISRISIWWGIRVATRSRLL